MECAKIKELLSEYIDDVLDSQRKTRVEEHLKRCQACSAELASLKAYIEEMTALKEVKAPADFLVKVHQRLRKPIGVEKTFRLLFVPARVKIPLELALVAALVILVISIFNVIPSKKAPPESLVKLAPREVKELAKLKDTAEKVLEPVVVLDKVAQSRLRKTEKPLELALLIKSKPSPLDRRRGTVRAARAKSKRGALTIEKGEGVKEKLEAAAKPKRRVALKFAQTMAPKPETLAVCKVLAEVKQLTQFMKGKVISVKYKKGTNQPQYITIELPRVNYNPFLKKLNQLGELQKPLPAKVVITEELVQLRIKFVISE